MAKPGRPYAGGSAASATWSVLQHSQSHGESRSKPLTEKRNTTGKNKKERKRSLNLPFSPETVANPFGMRNKINADR